MQLTPGQNLLPLTAALGDPFNVLAALVPDAASRDGEQLPADKPIFIRVIHLRPARFHTTKLSGAASGHLQDTDVCVSVHTLQNDNIAEPIIMSDPDTFHGIGTMVLRNLHNIPYVQLCELRAWRFGKRYLTVRGSDVRALNPASLDSFLARLLEADALPEAGWFLTMQEGASGEDDNILTWLLQDCEQADRLDCP